MRIKGFLLGVLSSLLVVFPTFAKPLPENLLYFYGQNGIYYYNGAENLNNCTPATEGGDNFNYSGTMVWSDTELAAILENQAIYVEAANAYGIPWQVLAVLHSMESSLARSNPGNGQGIYQLYSYTDGGTNENRFAPGEISEEEFLRQSMIAAQIVSGMLDGESAEDIQRMFFKYNGASEQYIKKALAMGYSLEEARNGAGSPYVMNRYDAERDPTNGGMVGIWAGRYTADGTYTAGSTSTAFGAFVKYGALSGTSVYCDEYGNDFGNGNGGSIAETALALSWDGRGHSKYEALAAYIEAMKAVGAYLQPCNGSGCAPIGASCDQFVGTVMRYSGADPNFPIFGPGVQQAYMASHPEMYQRVEATDASDLQPGDIFVTTENGRHIYIYVGNGMQASASFNDRTAEHFEGVYFSDNGTGGGRRRYTVYRRIQ